MTEDLPITWPLLSEWTMRLSVLRSRLSKEVVPQRSSALFAPLVLDPFTSGRVSDDTTRSNDPGISATRAFLVKLQFHESPFGQRKLILLLPRLTAHL